MIICYINKKKLDLKKYSTESIRYREYMLNILRKSKYINDDLQRDLDNLVYSDLESIFNHYLKILLNKNK